MIHSVIWGLLACKHSKFQPPQKGNSSRLMRTADSPVNTVGCRKNDIRVRKQRLLDNQIGTSAE